MTIEIREATPDDLHAICVLGQEVNRLHHDAWPQVFAPPSDPRHDASHWQQSVAKPDATAFVGEQAGQIVAFITVSLVAESNPLLQPMQVARVGSVCVSASLRRHGIGRSLMARVEQWAHERGAGDIRLNVWAFNAEALRFYEELGYAVRSHGMGKVLSRAA
jgi:GNAT superfamily N-acetyltransferase